MKRNPMLAIALVNTKKMFFAIFCCVLLMLVAAPAWAQEADPCNNPTIGTSAVPVGSATGCGVVITITGTSGHLVATVSGNGTSNGNPYDGDEDQLVGIQNSTGTMVNDVLTGAVTIGAIRLSAPPSFAIPFIVDCSSEGQVCSPPFSTNVTVTLAGPITVTYTASPKHCSAVQVQVSVDGTALPPSAFLNAGQSTGPIVTSPLSVGPHTVALQATGEVGGCNEGALLSWGGTLTLSGNIAAPTVTPSANIIAPATGTPLSNPFAFDGDGPCNYAQFTSPGEGSTADCFNDPSATANPGDDPFDYQGPNNSFVGISGDSTTGTVLFNIPIPPGQSTWFALENTPAAAVAIGETQTLATGKTNVFAFGPFTCTSDGCAAGSGTWTEQVYGDDLQLTPLSALISNTDQWTVFPIPVPAGPLGSAGFGPFTIGGDTEFGLGEFGIETPGTVPPGPPGFSSNSFPTLACIPYTDYSAAASIALDSAQPTCVEIERDFTGNATDGANVIWTGQLDYDIDGNSIPTVIGGPHVLWAQITASQPVVFGPTSPNSAPPFGAVSDFTVDALYAYTGATPVLESALGPPLGDPPPPKAQGPGGKSVFVSAFDPLVSEKSPIAAGVTVGFPGFEALFVGGIPVPSADTSNTNTPSCSKEAAQYLQFPSGKQVSVGAVEPVNCLLEALGVRVPWELLWDYTTTSTDTPVTNFQLCHSVNASGACTDAPVVSTPWVNLSSIPVANTGCVTGPATLSGSFANLAPPPPKGPSLPGQYSFLWEPVNNPTGCQVRVVLEFNTGTNAAPVLSYASPAAFVYSY